MIDLKNEENRSKRMETDMKTEMFKLRGSQGISASSCHGPEIDISSMEVVYAYMLLFILI